MKTHLDSVTRLYEPNLEAMRKSLPDDYITELLECSIPVFPCKPDKSPYTANGFKDASTDPSRVKQWLKQHPDALVGVPTGHVSKLLVVDIDPDGERWYVSNYERLVAGRVNKTPRGHHLIYRMPDAGIRCSASTIAPGVDIRANGGYIIWWPQQDLDFVGDMNDISDPPAWLLAAMTEKSKGTGSGIPNGQRNDTLTSLAGKLLNQGKDAKEITELLLAANKDQCLQPLPINEVENIARSVARYSIDDGIDDVGMIEDGDPLIRADNYLVRYLRHKIFRDMHGYGPKIVVWFAITEGEYEGSIIRAFYNIDVDGRTWRAKPGARLSREMITLFPDARRDRISPALLKNHTILAIVGSTKKGTYSTVQELIEIRT
ncbi:MAG: bifunctional DNA primase/polymerase [Xanthomonadales bacterium]|nr:bifunctional DNA primase/polymerase [Xanthomonadales bacterium]